MGTIHLLEAIRQVGSAQAVINVTTDKCYENKEWVWGYREDEPMGGFDPYSSSKGCSELVTAAYRHSYFHDQKIALASARAGNVIGGGDWAEDRLIPDILRSFQLGEPVVIRNPSSIRPWQHVLEPLSGYLMLAQRLWSEPAAFAQAWNFGPREEDAKPVQWIVENLAKRWDSVTSWKIDEFAHPHEAGHLKLDISKATSMLGWRPRWSLENALQRIVDWNVEVRNLKEPRNVCLGQIEMYLNAV